MINVVFLLLIFFMVAGVIESTPPLDVSLPESADAQEPVSQRILFVSADGLLALDGEQVSEGSLAVLVAQPVNDAIDQHTIAASAQDSDVSFTGSSSVVTDDVDIHVAPDSELPLGIQADATITMKRLKQVMDILRSAGIAEVELLTTRVPAVSN